MYEAVLGKVPERTYLPAVTGSGAINPAMTSQGRQCVDVVSGALSAVSYDTKITIKLC